MYAPRTLHEFAPPPAAPQAPAAFPIPEVPEQQYSLGDELPATSANAHRYVALAHRAMTACLDANSAALQYRGAVSALNAKRYRVAMAASRNIVDDCTGH